jgi:hypothetical protein
MELLRSKSKWAVVLLGLFFAFMTSDNAAGTTVTLNPTEDTHIDQYSPTTINGAKTFLLCRRGGTGYKLDILIKFDLSVIPPGTNINWAKLGMYYYHYNDGDPAGKNLTLYRITSAWSEATTNWNNRPTYNSTPLSQSIAPASYSWVEWDVTGAVNGVVNGVLPYLGWQISDPATSGYFSMIYFYSKENGSLIPYLEIDTGIVEQGWYWKSAYPNYAPSGMPDFDMKQDSWKTIFPGPNGNLESSTSGDDVVGSGGTMIAPGPDCQLQSTPSGDDYADWSFSGPAALANCFWWFDSKFGDPNGYPGDGIDSFPLVTGYDHTGKVVDQQQPLYESLIDLVSTLPGHVQSFVPAVPVLDAVQILLGFNYPGDLATIEVSIYNALPTSPAILPLGTSVRAITGPWDPPEWFQFHFTPPIALNPGMTYYIGVRVLDGEGNPHWAYAPYNAYPPGMAYLCIGPYALEPYPSWDFAFKTEYYSSGRLDDHEADNVPELIQELSYATGTCSEGLTDPGEMQAAIDDWLSSNGLAGRFVESTYTAPDFTFIESEIERSQDVILLLGLYGEKLVDQEQTQWDYRVDLYPWPPGHLQEFIPTVTTVDAVELLLKADNPTPTKVEVSIYGTFPNSPTVLPLGKSIMIVSAAWYAQWFQFHFEPPVTVAAGSLYYIAARTLDVQNNVEWCYITDDVYPGGEAWMNWDDYTLQSEPYQDFAFKTEYYSQDECERQGQHYVTCAGVNSQYQFIAFSDPLYDILEGPMGNPYNHAPHPADATVHNDAQYVSHDIYPITVGSPCGLLPYNWYLPNYRSGFKYTIVEKAIVICPSEECDCIPGDANGNTVINILDITYLINFVYKSGPAPVPYALCSGDPNCNCVINILDITYLISFLYKSGPAPCTCQQWLAACGPPLRK